MINRIYKEGIGHKRQLQGSFNPPQQETKRTAAAHHKTPSNAAECSTNINLENAKTSASEGAKPGAMKEPLKIQGFYGLYSAIRDHQVFYLSGGLNGGGSVFGWYSSSW